LGRSYNGIVPRALFVSDVHLTVDDREKLGRLRALFEARLGPGDALYLLGDIFEYWVSDGHAREPLYAELIEALARLTRSGVRVGYVAGNRDYLIGRPFASAAGATLLGRSARIELDGRAVHLEHGDMIFNTNWRHTAYRNLMRLGMLRRAAVRVPAKVGHVIGRGFRRLSKANTPAVEWTREELVERSRPVLERGVDVFVFGHIHLPQRIDVELAGRPKTLFVLGDWDDTGVYLEHDRSGFSLRPGF
jgi:UDP-2,3-diacylglucosamine hydrolase